MDVRAERRAMGAGIAFVVLFIAGAVTSFGGQANYDTSKDSAATIARKVLDAANDPGKQRLAIIGAYLLVIAGLALVWYTLGLRSRLIRSGAAGAAPTLVAAVGGLAAMACISTGALFGTIPGGIIFGDEPAPTNGDLARLISDLGTPMLLLGVMLPIAAVIAMTAYTARATAALPRLLCYAGILGVLGALAAVEFLPMVLPVLWLLGASIVGLTDRAKTIDVSVPSQAAATSSQPTATTAG